MARKSKAPDFGKIAENRRKSGLTQSEYWRRFGATQSGGSRYENGRRIPTSVGALIWLLETGRISEKDLAAAIKLAR